MSLASVMQDESELLLSTYDRHPVLLKRGKGVFVYDSEGRKYLDFLSGIGVNALGYAHPAINRVLAKQARSLVHTSNLFYHGFQSELARKLTNISGLDRCFFCNSGTEAWEAALKLARAYSVQRNGKKSRWRILAIENSFHGRTFGSLSTTWLKKYRWPFAPLVPGVVFVKFNDVADLESKFDDSVCAVCIEPVQGEAGIYPLSRQFMNKARALATRHGALMIADEIQSGLARTGRYFAYQHYGILPDIVTVAKPLAAGLPLGAMLTTEKVARCFHPGMHGTTFGGGPLVCAVAIEFLNVLEREKLVAHVKSEGAYFQRKLEGLAGKYSIVKEVRGRGLMLAIELHSADLAKATVAAMFQHGIIINRTHETALRFLPPYIVEHKHIDQVIAALDEIFSSYPYATGDIPAVATKGSSAKRLKKSTIKGRSGI